MSETVSVPVQNFVSDGNTLIAWLGSFWSQINQDPVFTQRYQQGRAIAAAEVYLSFLENLKILDRTAAPVFHRERWQPMVIRSDQADTGSAALKTLGMDPTPVIGPQEGNAFLEDSVFKIGGIAAYQHAVSYPVATTQVMAKVLTCITNDIVNPTVILVNGIDFVFEHNTIFFLRSIDPFSNPAFYRTVTKASGEEVTELLLWGCDVLIDRNLVYDHIGYVLNVHTSSTEANRSMLNSLWDMYNMGIPLRYLYAGWGAMLGVPTVLDAHETVDRVLTTADGPQVITDAHVYQLPPNSVLRSQVVPGAVLHAGEFFSTAIRIYDTLDPMKLDGANEYGQQLRTDVAQLFFPAAMFRAALDYGIGATWVVSDIVQAGVDANGNPKLKFTVHGSDDDIEAFWADFWAYCEARNISSRTCFSDYVGGTVGSADGVVYGQVAPLEFFMRYFLRANAFIVVIDRDQLAAASQRTDTATAIGLIRVAVPAYVLMFVIERRSVGPEEYDLEQVDDSGISKCVCLSVRDTATEGRPSATGMTYTARKPVMRWIPVCKETA